MSKEFSANIHDPNHTVEDYDIYFNGEHVEVGTNPKLIDFARQSSQGNKMVLRLSESIAGKNKLIWGRLQSGNVADNQIIAFGNGYVSFYTDGENPTISTGSYREVYDDDALTLTLTTTSSDRIWGNLSTIQILVW